MWLRREVAHQLFRLYFDEDGYAADDSYRQLFEAFRRWVWKILDRAPNGSWGEIEEILVQCQWDEFYETTELACSLLHYRERRKFQNEVNDLLAYEVMAWRFEDGEFWPTRPDEITMIFEEAKGLLSDPKYAGPNDQFRKANQHLSKRPDPDTQNCVKDAVGALEGVAQIVTNNLNTPFDTLVKGPLKDLIPLHLLQAINRLYIYRGNEPGVAHADDGESSVSLAEAELVLGMCATSIVYLGSFSPDKKVV